MKSKAIKSTASTLAEFFPDDLISDPHVRIVGRKEDVLRVKDKVMAVLDAKVSYLNSHEADENF